MDHYAIPKPVLDALLKYLVQRPYAEVADGIHALQQLELIPAASPRAPEDTL